MKKIGYIVLIFIHLLQGGGLLLIYIIQQYHVEYLMEQALENNQTIFQRLTMSLKEFQKYKINSHEISISGEMYDIKSIVITGNKVEMLGLKDTREENIIENISKTTDNRQNQQLTDRLLQLLTLVYVSRSPELLPSFPGNGQDVFHSICETIISHQPDISSPPPRLASYFFI